MKTFVVSGAASGIGAATTALLREQGDRVVTVDLHDADVVADLSTPAGRADAVAGVEQLTDVVHGLVPCAGIAGSTGVDSALVVSVNFFGAVALVRGLQPRLAAAGAPASSCSPPTRSPPSRAGARPLPTSAWPTTKRPPARMLARSTR